MRRGAPRGTGGAAREMKRLTDRKTWLEYLWITLGSALVAGGIYFFKFPNNFSFGGVSGLCIVLAQVLPFTAGQLNLVLNLTLLVVGWVALGRRFAIKTAYATVVVSVLTERLEVWCPLSAPLTDQPLLELIFAILLPAAGTAILFQHESSSGGTDILALIMKDRAGTDIGKGLILSDVAIVVCAALVFDVKTVLFSTLGLLAKSLVVDEFIKNMNLSKCFIVICDEAEPICKFITDTLHRSATVTEGQGAFTGKPKQLIFTVLKPAQAYRLRTFIHKEQPHAFMMISTSSEIVGKGFMRQ